MKTNQIKEMNRRKSIWIVLALLVFTFVTCSSNVPALGITPGRVTVVFEPNLEQIAKVTVVNTEHKAMNVSLNVGGEMANIIALDEDLLTFGAEDEQKNVTYRIRLPSSESEIGASGVKALIHARELVSNTHEGTSVGVNIAVEQQVYVITGITPIPLMNITESEKPNVTRIFVENYTKGDVAKVAIEIYNPKSQTLPEVYSTLFIYDTSKILRSQLNSTVDSIGPKNNVTLFIFWDTQGFDKGNYSGELRVYYDNKTDEQKLKLQLGEDYIIVDFGEFEEPREKPPTTIIFEKKKQNAIVLAVIVVLFVFAIIELIVYIHLKKKAKKIVQKQWQQRSFGVVELTKNKRKV
ncbi:MAG: hypothetical protein ACPLXC_03280 [Candidatus Pacearchaeota archaeon]